MTGAQERKGQAHKSTGAQAAKSTSAQGRSGASGSDGQLRAAVKRLIEAGQPEQIILFGSHARGDARADSDFDLLVVQSQSFGPGRSRLAEIARLERALGALPIAVDLLLYSRGEVTQLRGSLNHVIGRALREGEVLYVRP